LLRYIAAAFKISEWSPVPFAGGKHWRLRRSLEQWFDTLQIKAKGVRGICRHALLKVFGQHGAGVFAVRSILERDSQRLYQARLMDELNRSGNGVTPFRSRKAQASRCCRYYGNCAIKLFA